MPLLVLLRGTAGKRIRQQHIRERRNISRRGIAVIATVIERDITRDPPLLGKLPVIVHIHIGLFIPGNVPRPRIACTAVGKECLRCGTGLRVYP